MSHCSKFCWNRLYTSEEEPWKLHNLKLECANPDHEVYLVIVHGPREMFPPAGEWERLVPALLPPEMPDEQRNQDDARFSDVSTSSLPPESRVRDDDGDAGHARGQSVRPRHPAPPRPIPARRNPHANQASPVWAYSAGSAGVAPPVWPTYHPYQHGGGYTIQYPIAPPAQIWQNPFPPAYEQQRGSGPSNDADQDQWPLKN